jgi:hypothetical protein
VPKQVKHGSLGRSEHVFPSISQKESPPSAHSKPEQISGAREEVENDALDALLCEETVRIF